MSFRLVKICDGLVKLIMIMQKQEFETLMWFTINAISVFTKQIISRNPQTSKNWSTLVKICDGLVELIMITSRVTSVEWPEFETQIEASG